MKAVRSAPPFSYSSSTTLYPEYRVNIPGNEAETAFRRSIEKSRAPKKLNPLLAEITWVGTDFLWGNGNSLGPFRL